MERNMSRVYGISAAIAQDILQSHPVVAWNTNETGYVHFNVFKHLFEHALRIELTADIVDKLKQQPSIEFYPGDQYIRATFGHGGLVIAKMVQRSHTIYTGPQKIFCISHTSMDGLGAINAGRKVSMLVPPEFCFNKGVRAYVDIDVLARNGIFVWHQNGDRQTKVFCFSPDLRNFTYGTEYTPDYFKDLNLLRTHGKLCESLRAYHPTMSDTDFKKFAIERIKRLVIHEDTDDEDDTNDEDAIPAFQHLCVVD